MRRIAILLILLFACGATTASYAQVKCNEGLEEIDRDAEARMTAMDFIHDVAANELVFSKAFADFGYRLDVHLMTLGSDNAVDGEFHEVTEVAFDASTRARRITTIGATVDTLKRVTLPRRDVDALRDAFVISPDALADRDIVYSGRQKLDDFRAIVFDVLPRSDQASTRGFTGRTWVRGRDRAIARICGRINGGPFGAMRYLVQRTKVADKYWFPTTITADESVRSGDADVHVRVEVKYSDYTARP